MDEQTKASFDRIESRFDRIDQSIETLAARSDRTGASLETLAARFDRSDAESKARFDRSGESIEALAAVVEKHLTDHDRRFEEGIGTLAGIANTHFNAHELRFGALERRFDALELRMDAGFAGVETRFAAMDDRLTSAGEHLTQTGARVDQLRDHFAAALDDLKARVAILDSDVTTRKERIAAGGTPALVDLLRFRLELLVGRIDTLAKNVLARLDQVEQAGPGVGIRLDTISDEMCQRFRALNDRLADIDRRLAA